MASHPHYLNLAHQDQFSSTLFKQRRLEVLKRLKSQKAIAVISSNNLAVRNDDVHYPYRQDSNFLYLTGWSSPDCLLILNPFSSLAPEVLFLPEKNPLKETWDGRRLGVTQAPSILGVDKAMDFDHITTSLFETLIGGEFIYLDLCKNFTLTPSGTTLLQWIAANFDTLRRSGMRRVHHEKNRLHGLKDIQEILAPLRALKSSEEIEALKKAAWINEKAHRLTMAYATPGKRESALEAMLLATYKMLGADTIAYGPIVAAGGNALILHYGENNCELREGDLCLIDAGPEYLGYASDITRTFPISKKFTTPQRELYQLVLLAQTRVQEAARAHRTLAHLHQVSEETLLQGLLDLKIIQASFEEAKEKKLLHTFFMHGNGHFLGLDVHDTSVDSLLLPQSVITNEPGLYIPTHLSSVPDAFKGIGIRIEDDLVIEEHGCFNLNAGVPHTPEEVESACQSDWQLLWNDIVCST